ncbi:MAG: DUF4221 family protein [Mongoliitalea sp.]
MYKLNWIIISVCTLLIIACSEKKQEESLGVFREVNTYQLDLDRFTSPVEDHYQYVTNWRGEEAYAFHIEAKGQIKLYSLATGALLETLPYALNQPNLQYGIHDFYILNEDSIFLNRRRAYKVYLIDSAYEIIKTLNFMSENDEIDKNTGWPKSKDTFLPAWNRNRFFKKIGEDIFLTGAPNFDARFADATYTKTLLNSYSLSSEKITPLLGFPEKMQGKAWGEHLDNVFLDYSPDGDFFVISYAADERVYVTDRSMRVIREFDAFPQHFKKAPPLSNKEVENNDALRAHWQENQIFGPIHWDPFRNMIYRIMEEPNEDYVPNLLRDPIQRARNMVVMAFDPNQEYKKVAEMRLKKTEKGLFLDRCFVNEKGLNITYLDLENEDKLYFKTFVVE